MKKLGLLILSGLTAFSLAACGNDSTEDAVKEEKPQTNTAETEKPETKTDKTVATKPIDATKEDLCAFCDMKIYTKDETMGVFTGQGVDSKGNNLFFDDAGCILNYERKSGESLQEQWVQDYLTKEWIDVEKSVPVHADIQTPMKYGYAFFDTKENAEKYVSENSDINAAISSWEEIDNISNERYKKKMEMQKKKDENSNGEHNKEHGDDSGSGH